MQTWHARTSTVRTVRHVSQPSLPVYQQALNRAGMTTKNAAPSQGITSNTIRLYLCTHGRTSLLEPHSPVSIFHNRMRRSRPALRAIWLSQQTRTTSWAKQTDSCSRSLAIERSTDNSAERKPQAPEAKSMQPQHLHNFDVRGMFSSSCQIARSKEVSTQTSCRRAQDLQGKLRCRCHDGHVRNSRFFASCND